MHWSPPAEPEVGNEGKVLYYFVLYCMHIYKEALYVVLSICSIYF